MIKLEVKEYCHGCRDFESDTHYDYAGEINNISIFCKHRNKCACLKTYIEKEMTNKPSKPEPAKDDIICNNCEYGIGNGCKVFRNGCGDCPQYVDSTGCKCQFIIPGEPCPDYKEYKHD